MIQNPVLFLDFDGVLHQDDIIIKNDIIYDVSDRHLFEWLPWLSETLLQNNTFKSLRIVLCTAWVNKYGYDYCVNQLGPLSILVIGHTNQENNSSRFNQIIEFVKLHGLDSWLVLDDTPDWPDQYKDFLVNPNSVCALQENSIRNELLLKLTLLCQTSK